MRSGGSSLTEEQEASQLQGSGANPSLSLQKSLFNELRRKVSSPKEFSIRSIKAKDACELNAIWHSRFPSIHWSNVVRSRFYVCYILEIDSIAYGVAIWSSPIAANRLKDGQRLLELRRMALSPECPKNTATWMLARMKEDITKRFPDVIRLISYQDTEVHIGTIYKAANWKPVNTQKKFVSWFGHRTRNKEKTSATKTRWEMEIERKNK